MESIGNQKPWVPQMSNKDCSLVFCTLYCPHLCYVIYPPPPSFEVSSPNVSPLVIAVVGIVASAFLVACYYIMISNFCGSVDSTQRQSHDASEELGENHNPSLHQPWQAATTGLDETLIKTITVCKYRKGDGLVQVPDCSVCLNEFEEDEYIRLLPKCCHAFHLPCIDTWLKSHSNCPLCRANIFCFDTSSLQLPPPALEILSRNEVFSESQNENEVLAVRRDHERADLEEVMHYRVTPKPALRVLSDLGDLHGRDTIIEIRDEGYDSVITRSISMDPSLQTQSSLSVAEAATE